MRTSSALKMTRLAYRCPRVVPALIDEAIWYAVQEILDKNREGAGRNNSDPDATLLLAGLVFCRYCGRAMHATHMRAHKRYGDATGKRYWTYVCDSRRTGCPGQGMSIASAGLNRRVWDMLTRDVLCDRDALLAIFERR
jgi:hypothetical protein